MAPHTEKYNARQHSEFGTDLGFGEVNHGADQYAGRGVGGVEGKIPGAYPIIN